MPKARKLKSAAHRDPRAARSASQKMGWAAAALLFVALGFVVVWPLLKHPGQPGDTTGGETAHPAELTDSNRPGPAVAGPPAIVPTNTVPGEGTAAPVSNEERVSQLVNQGVQMLRVGRPAVAVALFRQALEIDPGDESLHYNLGIALTRVGANEEARKAYLEALRLFPDYTDVRINLGNLLARQGQLAEAAEQLNLALKIEPDRASAHNALGTVLARQGHPREAANHFLEATRRQTNYFEAEFNLGNAYLSLGQADNAARQFRRVLQQRPDFEPAREALEKALREAAAGSGRP